MIEGIELRCALVVKQMIQRTDAAVLVSGGLLVVGSTRSKAGGDKWRGSLEAVANP